MLKLSPIRDKLVAIAKAWLEVKLSPLPTGGKIVIRQLEPSVPGVWTKNHGSIIAILQCCLSIKLIFKTQQIRWSQMKKIIIFKWSPDPDATDRMFNTVYMTNHKFTMSWQLYTYLWLCRLSLNGYKYIQLSIKKPIIHLIERHQFTSLNVLVHVKPPKTTNVYYSICSHCAFAPCLWVFMKGI